MFLHPLPSASPWPRWTVPIALLSPWRLGRHAWGTGWPREVHQSMGGQEVPSTHSVLVPIWHQGPRCGPPGGHSQASTQQYWLTPKSAPDTLTNPQDHTTNPHPLAARASSSHSITSRGGRVAEQARSVTAGTMRGTSLPWPGPPRRKVHPSPVYSEKETEAQWS